VTNSHTCCRPQSCTFVVMTAQWCQRASMTAIADDAPRTVAPEETLASGLVRRPAPPWLVMTHLELAAMPTAVPCFRKHARLVALEWGLPDLAEKVELIVSELVTNSVRFAERSRGNGLAAEVVQLWLFSDLHCILVRVWDSSSEMPVRQDAGPDEESGRGLMLVDQLSSEWGAYRKAHGKVVWVLI
jgi:anti-sigma regulatory factor (Ser/Thr protein kinase)